VALDLGGRLEFQRKVSIIHKNVVSLAPADDSRLGAFFYFYLGRAVVRGLRPIIGLRISSLYAQQTNIGNFPPIGAAGSALRRDREGFENHPFHRVPLAQGTGPF